MGRRVLVTGLGSFWGGRTALALEQDPSVDMIVGLDTVEPSVPLERTEYVKADQNYSILSRIVKATQVDTIVHTFLIVNSIGGHQGRGGSSPMSGRALNEANVIGTMNLLAAASAPHTSVRQVVVKSSTLVYGSSRLDPVWFGEDSPRPSLPRTRVERSLIEVEGYLRDFADDNPHVVVTLLRFANVLGEDIVTDISAALSRSLAPQVLGFDPLVQFVEEDDVIRCLELVTQRQLPGIYNVAGDGRVPWSEVAALCGARLVPLPPVLTGLATSALTRLRVMDVPPELLDLLRFGRGVDNRRLKRAGFSYRYTTAGAVERFARITRLRATIGESSPTYHYERDVEAFFRHSPAVVRQP